MKGNINQLLEEEFRTIQDELGAMGHDHEGIMQRLNSMRERMRSVEQGLAALQAELMSLEAHLQEVEQREPSLPG